MHNIPILPPGDPQVEPPVSSAGSKVRSPLHVGALLLALTVGAVGCGSATDDSAQVAADSDASAVSADESSDDVGADDEASAADASAADSDDAGRSDDAAAESDDGDQTADEEAVVENVFPDLNVLSITDGADINLQDELANGDTAVLLWFFAPH